MIFLVERVSGMRYDDDGNELPPIEEAKQKDFDWWDCRTFKTPEEYDEHQKRYKGFKPWLSEGTDHGMWKGGICRKREETQKLWYIDIEPAQIIDLLIKYEDGLILFNANADSAYRTPTIRIYDDQIY